MRLHTLRIAEGDLSRRSIPHTYLSCARIGFRGAGVSRRGVYQYRPSISQLCLLIAGTRQPDLPLGNKLCVCMFCCICGSLGIEGSTHPGETRTSLCLLCQVHVLTPIVEIALVDCEASYGQTSSQLHQIVCVTGDFVLGSKSAQADDVPDIKCAPSCRMSSFPLG